MKTILIGLLCLVLTGCMSTKTLMNNYMGVSKQILIANFGPPVRIASDGSDGEVLVYAKQVYAPQLNVNYWEYKMFYAHADGILYHWRLSRENVPPTQVVVSFR